MVFELEHTDTVCIQKMYTGKCEFIEGIPTLCTCCLQHDDKSEQENVLNTITFASLDNNIRHDCQNQRLDISKRIVAAVYILIALQQECKRHTALIASMVISVPLPTTSLSPKTPPPAHHNTIDMIKFLLLFVVICMIYSLRF